MWDTGQIFSYDNHKTKNTMLNWWWYMKVAGLYWRCIEMSHLHSSLVLCLFRKCVQNCVHQRTVQFGYSCPVAANQDPREAGQKTRRRLPGQVKRKSSDRGRPRALKRSSPVRRWKFWASWETERKKNRRTVSGTTLKVCCERTLEVCVLAAPTLCGVRPLFQSRIDPPVLRSFGPFVAESCLELPPKPPPRQH